ncbi:hypothetical protein F4818DRAFT_47287 [Hypoxylon cercidicola]|nr:hypothetical protein F4818DRAFT_47287 [Hypoxylon cercidicola]
MNHSNLGNSFIYSARHSYSSRWFAEGCTIMNSATARPRDFIGYGDRPLTFSWPGGKKFAINFAINYDEGTELSPFLGDTERDRWTWVRTALCLTERDLSM